DEKARNRHQGLRPAIGGGTGRQGRGRGRAEGVCFGTARPKRRSRNLAAYRGGPEADARAARELKSPLAGGAPCSWKSVIPAGMTRGRACYCLTTWQKPIDVGAPPRAGG